MKLNANVKFSFENFPVILKPQSEIHAMFFPQMKEKNEGIVKVKNVGFQVMGAIVDFLYSGEISMTSENNREFYMAADYLMIESKCLICSFAN